MHTESQTWTQLSANDFAALGLDHVAYIVRVKDEKGQPAFAVRAANGADMAVMPVRDVAVAAIRQNEMEPLSVH